MRLSHLALACVASLLVHAGVLAIVAYVHVPMEPRLLTRNLVTVSVMDPPRLPPEVVDVEPIARPRRRRVRRPRPEPVASETPELEAEPEGAGEPAQGDQGSAGAIDSTTSTAPGGLGVTVGTTGGTGNATMAATPRPRVDRRALIRGWLGRLNRIFQERALRAYPPTARRRGLEGTVRLSIRIDPAGRVLAVRVTRSSGHERLDRAAREAAEAVDRVPAPPAALEYQTRSIPLGVVYQID